MIRYITILFLFFNFSFQAQTKKTIREVIKKVSSEESALQLSSEYPDWTIQIVETSNLDSEFPQEIIKLKVGKLKSVNQNGEKYTYKLISKKTETEYRASYIYLDGQELSKKEIDSIRTLIIQEYNSGVSFGHLVENYNMDGNSNNGDLGWFKPGMMFPEFENAVKEHAKNDIFTLDIESQNWYYVVLKTYDNRNRDILTLIKIKESDS